MFKQRKNKTFQYQSRFSKESKTVLEDEKASENADFISKWQNHRQLSKKKRKGGLSVKLLVFILVLLLICMYLLENRFK